MHKFKLGNFVKYPLLPLILFLSSCTTTTSTRTTGEATLTGKLLGSYVSMASGLVKGHILHLESPSSVNVVSGIGAGDPSKVLLVHDSPKSLDSFIGKEVKVAGKLQLEHAEIFHTDFVLKVSEVIAQ